MTPDDTRNGHRNGNQNPEWSGLFSNGTFKNKPGVQSFPELWPFTMVTTPISILITVSGLIFSGAISTGWQRPIGYLILIIHFLQKSPVSSGSFAKRDPQLKASYGSSPPWTRCSENGLYESTPLPKSVNCMSHEPWTIRIHSTAKLRKPYESRTTNYGCSNPLHSRSPAFCRPLPQRGFRMLKVYVGSLACDSHRLDVKVLLSIIGVQYFGKYKYYVDD